MAKPGPVAAGWYEDPTQRYPRRYWDGQHWTDWVASESSDQQIDQLRAEMVPDPGWIPAAAALLPWFGLLVQHHHRRNPLLQLRMLFLASYSSLALYGLVLAILPSQTTAGPSVAVCLAVMLALGTAALIAILVVRRRTATGTMTLERAKQHRSSFFIKIAAAEPAALLGFVFAIITHRPWIYAVGAGITALEWTLAAPTHRDIYMKDPDLPVAFIPKPRTERLTSTHQ